MTRSHFITAVKFATLLFIVTPPISVRSVLYRIKFDPTKFMLQCKNPTVDHFYKYYDFSNLNVSWNEDSVMSAVGYVVGLDNYPNDSPLSIYNTAKKKVRGRWIDTPFRSEIKDLCKDYFKPDMWWYEHITQHFVGDERLCPPPKGVRLPFNFTVELKLDIPLHLPTGEYLSRSMFKYKGNEACFECYIDVSEA